MTINIENSPGATVNIVQGNQCTTTMDVFAAASAIQKGLGGYADIIDKGEADDITIVNQENDRVVFNNENRLDYRGHTKKQIEEDLIELECNILRFNKRTLHGSLEIYDGEISITKPFVAHAGIIDDCLDAFKAPFITMEANREVEINSLGEVSVFRYHAVSVTPHN